MGTPSGSFTKAGGYAELTNNVADGTYAAKADDPTYDPWNHYYSDVLEVHRLQIDPALYAVGQPGMDPDSYERTVALAAKSHIQEQTALWAGTGGNQGALWDLTPTDFGGPGYSEEPIGGIIPPTTTLEDRQRRGSYYVTGGPEFPEYSQYQQFAGFLGGDPTYQAVSPGARASMRRQFDPLAAQYALQQAMGTLDPYPSDAVPVLAGEWTGGAPPQSMTQFLGSGPQAYSPTQTADIFQTLAPMFGPQGFNAPSLPGAQDALQFLSQPGVAENIISQYAQAQVNPMFAASVNRNLQNAFAAFAQKAGATGAPISDVGGGILSQFFSPTGTGIGGWSYQ